MINIFIQQSPAFSISLLSARKKENKTKFAEVSTYIWLWNCWRLWALSTFTK